jgi:hypothetical protein
MARRSLQWAAAPTITLDEWTLHAAEDFVHMRRTVSGDDAFPNSVVRQWRTLAPSATTSLEDILRHLNAEFDRTLRNNATGARWRILYDPIERRVKTRGNPDIMLVLLSDSPTYGYLLGGDLPTKYTFRYQPEDRGEEIEVVYYAYAIPSVVSSPPRLIGSSFNTFIYLSLIGGQPVGNVLVPLLGIVPGSGANAASIGGHYSWQHLLYLPVLQQRVRTISVKLCTETGELVPFSPTAQEHVVLRIHLRRRSTLYKMLNGGA